MALFNIFDSVLDFLFGYFLFLPPFWFIFLMTFAVTLFITLIYKYTTDQVMMKQLKQEMKELQADAKKHMSNRQKMAEIQRQQLEKSMHTMKHSMRPMLYTMLPMIIIIGWLATNIAFHTIPVGDAFSVELYASKDFSGNATLLLSEDSKTRLSNQTSLVQPFSEGKAAFTFVAESEGTSLLSFMVENTTQTKQIHITSDLEYEPLSPTKRSKTIIDYLYSREDAYFDGDAAPLYQVQVTNKPVRPIGEKIKFFKWHFNWLGIYFILSLVFSITLRKLLKVH